MGEEEVGPVVEVAVQKIRVCNKTKESKVKKGAPRCRRQLWGGEGVSSR